MVIDGPAAARPGRTVQGDSQLIENPVGSGVGGRRRRPLYAALQQQHFPGVHPCGRRAHADPGGHLRAQRARQQWSHHLPQAQPQGKQRGPGYTPAQQPAPGSLQRRAGRDFLDQFAADVQQLPILHSRRAGGLAAAAAQAPVQVGAGLLAGLAGFQQLLDQVDTAPGTVAFVAGVEVGWAGGQAETTVHTGAHEFPGLCTPVGCGEFRM